MYMEEISLHIKTLIRFGATYDVIKNNAYITYLLGTYMVT